MKTVLGVDIGGTNVKAGVLSPDGRLLAAASTPTGALVHERDFARIDAFLRDVLADAGCSTQDVVGVGVAVPGPVDASGQAGMLPNIELDAQGLRRALKASFPLSKLVFLNDANAAALGEWWKGAARAAASVVLVAIGTGVGGGVVVDGRLLQGAFGAGGEIGHLTVKPDEHAACGCGRFGCLEQYASATGVVGSYLRECDVRGSVPVALDGPTDTLSVFRACQQGDQAAQAAIHAMAACLGRALAQVSVVLDPALYLVGGGVSAGWELFGDELRDAFHANCLEVSRKARIMPAALGNDAALYGSAYLALQA